MNKELMAAGRPYLWALYYALFILFTLIFISGFRSVPAGMVFLIALLIKAYAGNKLVINFFYWYKSKEKSPQYKKQIRPNSVIVGFLLLIDVLLLVHLPEVFKQTYTLSAVVLFLLVSGHCMMSRWKSNFSDVYAT
jgi:NADH:ubiquinone oxidoreductase subunit 6 (subunit J)